MKQKDFTGRCIILSFQQWGKMTIVLALAVFAVSASAIAQEAPLQLAENVWQVNFQTIQGHLLSSFRVPCTIS